ncbi:HD domain-containing protein [Rickettsia endosymbiont of Orchestes rusci]|uniref:HD domain-containing protein n=1 Tax=Rickettsia endosymbiont of Orchestes rusci TaxID=3066250 RepID=UPI00209C8298|nr:HD domain-containing protein [Rickettsia endosymbiont of Ceutorhynchus assimilis]
MEDINWWEEKFEMCGYAARLLDKVTSLNKLVQYPIDIREIKKGIYYARKYHGNQMRQSGDPYYSHPIEVAYMLAEFTAYEAPKLFIPTMLNAALLHDTIEDTPLTEDDIAKIFDKDIAKHVEGLTRVKPSGKVSVEESLNLLIQQKRHNTALIKIFDRVHNIQTLGAKSPEKAKKIIKETLKSFITLAVYLAIPKIEQQFYQLCFQVLNKTPFIEKTLLSYDINLPPLAFQNDFYRNNSQ